MEEFFEWINMWSHMRDITSSIDFPIRNATEISIFKN